MTPAMRVGVDFDNTIVRFDPIFYRAALDRGWIPAETPANKEKIRDLLRKNKREDDWTELQGAVYGELILQAAPFPGVKEFFKTCTNQKVFVAIVSHKTKTPHRGPAHDLHMAAQSWLQKEKFYEETGLDPGNVYFESDREKKIRRIRDLQLTHFVDDLPEFFDEPMFPLSVRKILFDPENQHDTRIQTAQSWAQLRSELMPVLKLPK